MELYSQSRGGGTPAFKPLGQGLAPETPKFLATYPHAHPPYSTLPYPTLPYPTLP